MRIRPLPSNPVTVLILAVTWHGPRPIRPGPGLRRTAGNVEALPPAPSTAKSLFHHHWNGSPAFTVQNYGGFGW